MEQAKYYPCDACQTPIEPGHKFCGRCGGPTPGPVMDMEVKYWSDLQDPTKASLVVIRGETLEGLTYHLRANEHLLGGPGAPISLDDPFVSPQHANLFYRGKELFLHDEDSVNGIYLRIRGRTKLAPGDTFLAGDQVFRVEPMPQVQDHTDAQGTYFYGSPTYSAPFRVVQLLERGGIGIAHCPRGPKVTVGRAGADINVLADLYLSPQHCTIEQTADGFFLTDLESQNGTYVRLKRDHRLNHGDYFAVGRKVMRVEMNG
jgi:pSer/pThr/pTyr-binding forkhead associated (FHA) protein